MTNAEVKERVKHCISKQHSKAWLMYTKVMRKEVLEEYMANFIDVHTEAA